MPNVEFSFCHRFVLSLFVIYLLVFNIAHAQHDKLDSLSALLITMARDSSRVKVLLQLSREMYRSGRYDDEARYATEGLKLSKMLNYANGEGEALAILGHVAMRKGSYDSALQYLEKAKVLFTARKNFRSLANVHLFTGQVNDYLAKYNIALDQYKTALELIESYPDAVIEFKILNSTGITHFNKGSYETALEYYVRALKVSERFEDKLYYASVLNNIGVVYMSILQYDDALQYFLKYLQTMRAMGQTRFVAVAMLNAGEAFMKKQSYPNAIQYLDSALATYHLVNEKRGMSLSHSNLGDCYMVLNDYANAETHYNACIAIAESIRSEEALLRGLLGGTDLYLKKGEKEKAARYLERANEIAKNTGSMLWLEKAYLFNSKLDSARANYKGAYNWFKTYSALNDSLFNERKSQQVLQLRELYESEKKDKEILLLSEAKKIEELKASSNQKLLFVSIGFFVIIITATSYWLYVKSRHSAILREQNSKITNANNELKKLVDKVEEQNKALAQKNEALEDLHREKDGLIGVVAHDLRAPLNRISGLVQLLSAGRQLTHDDNEIIRVIEKVCNQGNGLIKDLLEINQYENSESVAMANVEITAHVEALLSHYDASLSKKDLKLFFEHEGTVTVATNVHYLDRILDNIVTNAIKFSPTGREIYVKIFQKDTAVQIVVEDQGQGFHPDDLPHLFRKFKKLSARPTGGESSTGLGLSIVKTLAEKVGGSVNIESEWGKGAAVTIALPCELKHNHSNLVFSAQKN